MNTSSIRSLGLSNAFILNFYHNGKLHMEEDACPFALREDLEYWGLDEFSFESCCQNKYLKSKDDVQQEIRNHLEPTKA